MAEVVTLNKTVAHLLHISHRFCLLGEIVGSFLESLITPSHPYDIIARGLCVFHLQTDLAMPESTMRKGSGSWGCISTLEIQ